MSAGTPEAVWSSVVFMVLYTCNRIVQLPRWQAYIVAAKAMPIKKFRLIEHI